MKAIHHAFLPMLLAVFPLVTAAADTPSSTQTNNQAEDTYKDVQETLGSVPSFIKLFPENSVAGAWAQMKNFQMGKTTALNSRTKDLIGLAVAGQIPCRYCSYFHEAAAKSAGASDQEIREAVAVAALVRDWGTIVNGSQIDEVAFRRDVDRLVKNAGRTAKAPMTRESGMREAPAAVSGDVHDVLSGKATAEDTRREIERTMGFQPGFLKSVPDSALPGLWAETKQLIFSPDTNIGLKEKHLIGLAVAAQIPDRLGVYFHTKNALNAGATDQELREAVAMAGETRHWSTILNGLRVDEKQFQTETDDVLQKMKERGGK